MLAATDQKSEPFTEFAGAGDEISPQAFAFETDMLWLEHVLQEFDAQLQTLRHGKEELSKAVTNPKGGVNYGTA